MSKEQINLSDALNEINSIKTDLGTALNNKGMTVTQEFSSYPTAVTNQSTRTLQFPCNQIETYQFMIGTGLNGANIELDSISSGTAQFGQIYKYENSVVSRIAKDSNRDISIVALNTPDIDYTEQLGQYNAGAATATLTGQNTNLRLGIVPAQAGWVQFKVTDTSNVKNYYINAVVENFDPGLITCYDTRTWYGYADYMEVAANSLQQGQKYVFKPAGNYNRVSNNNENINSVKFTNVNPYLPYWDMTDLTAMQALYPTLDHMTVEAYDPTMVTITNEMYSETQQNEYIVECVGYGSNNITFTYYDDQDTQIYSWDFYIEIAQTEQTETLAMEISSPANSPYSMEYDPGSSMPAMYNPITVDGMTLGVSDDNGYTTVVDTVGVMGWPLPPEAFEYLTPTSISGNDHCSLSWVNSPAGFDVTSSDTSQWSDDITVEFELNDTNSSCTILGDEWSGNYSSFEEYVATLPESIQPYVTNNAEDRPEIPLSVWNGCTATIVFTVDYAGGT